MAGGLYPAIIKVFVACRESKQKQFCSEDRCCHKSGLMSKPDGVFRFICPSCYSPTVNIIVLQCTQTSHYFPSLVLHSCLVILLEPSQCSGSVYMSCNMNIHIVALSMYIYSNELNYDLRRFETQILITYSLSTVQPLIRALQTLVQSSYQ